MQILRRGSTNYVRLTHLFDTIDREYLDDATVVATAFDAAGGPITGVTALPVTYQAASNPVEYLAEIPHTVTLPADGTEGTVVVTATSAAAKVRKFPPEPVRFED